MPDLDDVVNRNLPPAELRERAHELVLRGIALAALPEAEGPLRVQGGLARKGAVTTDDFVIVVARHEVEVQFGLEFRPEAQALLLLHALGHGDLQAEVGNTAVGLPEHLDGLALAGLEMDLVAEAVRVPGRTPAAGHHFFSTDLGALETGVILGEIVITGHWSLEFSLIFHESALERQLGQVADPALITIVQGLLPLDELVSAGWMVGSRQRAFHTVLVIELEHIAQVLIRLGVAPTAPGVGVEQASNRRP